MSSTPDDLQLYQDVAVHCAGHPRLREVVVELAQDAGVVGDDPKAYLESKGFELPDDATVEIEPPTTDSGAEITICIFVSGHVHCITLQPPIVID